jgi:hypothetical protein
LGQSFVQSNKGVGLLRKDHLLPAFPYPQKAQGLIG